MGSMIPWALLGSARIPGEESEVRLYQRGAEYSIRVGPVELMNSRVHASEATLATAPLERLRDRARVDILIGGLGMGFTVAAAIANSSPDSHIVVAELVGEVIEWNRGPLGAVAGNPLDDPRVEVRHADVAAVLRGSARAFDAILLDVDNGPSALTAEKNHQLYGYNGLRIAHRALRPGGILAIWSQGDDPNFTRRLNEVGFASEQLRVRGRGKAGGWRYLIWLATRR